MNGGIIATIVAIISLLVTFLAGRKTGSIKENEKLRLNLEAYTEKMEERTKEAETKADTQERKAELATKVAESIAQAAQVNNAQELAARDANNDEEALRIAQQQAQQAKEFMLR